MLAGCRVVLLGMSAKTATGPLEVMRNTVRTENHMGACRRTWASLESWSVVKLRWSLPIWWYAPEP